MDYTASKQRAGCPDLFRAICHARPRLHCFGHIHEAWARLITWQKNSRITPSHFTDIDNERPVIMDNMSCFKHTRFYTEESKAEKFQRKQHYRQQRCYPTSHTTKDENPLE
ncbi:hypothetical protein N7G274_002282 [Stereocaulon virgatum]|uniref:Uncharacterized protein n=1 Tax=Stereocaulon virgatum TaxID=373712 RepID=A0ABR4AHH7_9LECA